MKYVLSIAAAMTLTIGVVTDAEARRFRVAQVPNGAEFGCGLCHLNSNGGGPRTGFGSQVAATLIGNDNFTASVNWAAIYDMDGDADGYSNGRELGDPDGTWAVNDPDPSGDIYNPASRDDSPCGDGVIENPPEECDGDAMFDLTCEDLGWGPGELSCNSVCKINESACEGFTVPNNEPGTNNANNNTGTNNSSNNATTNGDGPNNDPSTNNATGTNNDPGSNNEPGTSNEDEEMGGCSAVGAGSAPLWTLLLAGWFGLGRRRQAHRRVS